MHGPAESNPAVGALHRLALERAERPWIPLVDVLKGGDDQTRAARRRARNLRAGDDVRLFPAVHDIPLTIEHGLELAVPHQMRHAIQSNGRGAQIIGFSCNRFHRDPAQVAAILPRCDGRHVPRIRSCERHLVRQAAVGRDDVRVPDRQQPLRHAASSPTVEMRGSGYGIGEALSLRHVSSVARDTGRRLDAIAFEDRSNSRPIQTHPQGSPIAQARRIRK